MPAVDSLLSDANIQSAIEELQALIQSHFPEARFEISSGPESGEVYLIAVVDTEDVDDVMSVYVDRLVDLQVEKALPVYVMTLRPREHITLPENPYYDLPRRSVA